MRSSEYENRTDHVIIAGRCVNCRVSFYSWAYDDPCPVPLNERKSVWTFSDDHPAPGPSEDDLDSWSADYMADPEPMPEPLTFRVGDMIKDL